MVTNKIPLMRVVLLCMLLLSLHTLVAQQKFTLSGYITDKETDEKLPGTTVLERTTGTGVVTNNDGYYTLSLPKGEYEIVFSFVGYDEQVKDIKLSQNRTQDIKLSASVSALKEVIISAKKEDHNVKSTEISVERLNIRQIEKIPVIMGETDIFKTIQLLPGITGVAEGRSGFIVRGSGIDQNRILMDGMPLYYSSHMQGLYSVFNSDAVDALTVYKGGIPARYGGRGASVVDVRMKESNFEKYHAKVSAGLIASKFSLEAPVIKDRLSLFVAGRFTKPSFGRLHDEIKENRKGIDRTVLGGKGTVTSTGDFYFFDPYESWKDLNAKIIFKINDKNSLFISGYMGSDSALVTGGLTEWGNRAASVRWNHKYNSKLSSNTSLIHSRYYTEQFGGIYHFSSGLATNSFRQEFSYFPNDRNEFRFGVTSEYQDFNHGGLEDLTQDDAGKFMPPMQGLESAFYVENERKITSRFSAHFGLRYSMYHRLGPGNSFTYDEESNEPLSSVNFSKKTDVMAFHHNLEPRLALTYLLDEKSSLKLSFNRNAQYLRLMTLGQEIEWYDIWMPSTENIDPMLTDQFALGYFRNFLDNQIQFSVESYYKLMKGAADFEDGLHNYLVDNLEAYVATGKGQSYGLEVSVEKPRGKFNGRLSYNLGRSEYQIDVINKGRWYPNMFDKTHSLSVIASYDIFKNFSISGTFLFSTGRPVTLPEGYYFISGTPFPYWEGRNKYRLPDYHRLDFGFKYDPDFLTINLKKHNRHIKTGFEVSLYNVYNRRNIHTIEYTSNFKGTGKGGSVDSGSNFFEAYGVSTYGFMPSFLINFKF